MGPVALVYMTIYVAAHSRVAGAMYSREKEIDLKKGVTQSK